ncbi:winged helix-turn-helix domain-containing protein [Streptomyces pactum]|uniref:winged helix-turn-helix domain-containing protein n=1 Tax=Streptomyces pactum TaxID=68249 RepID=UPI001E51B546|nr:winged helix-turn-helix domain-containing protein [Streptomyces pactum]
MVEAEAERMARTGEAVIRIRFTAADLARVRFAARPAPLQELNTALLMLGRPRDGLLFDRWRGRLLRALPESARPFGDLVPAGQAPAFLDVFDEDLREGLATLRATPPDLVRAETERVYARHPAPPPRWLRDLHRGDPAAWRLLGRAQLAAFDTVLRPVWDQVADLHREEFTRHALTVAEHGVGAALTGLVPGARFHRDVWELPGPDLPDHQGGAGRSGRDGIRPGGGVSGTAGADPGGTRPGGTGTGTAGRPPGGQAWGTAGTPPGRQAPATGAAAGRTAPPAAGGPREFTLGGRGLVLLPTFHWTGGPLVAEPPGRPLVVTYPAGPGLPLRPGGAADPDQALAGVLGRTRLDILTLLTEEHTTGGLARRLGVSSATVSAHTAALRGAGLITTVRAGRAVAHRRTRLGTLLVRHRDATTDGRAPGRTP